MAWPFTAAMTGLRTRHAGTATADALNSVSSGTPEGGPSTREVGAGAEGRRRPGHDHGPDCVVGVTAGVVLGQRIPHLTAERIALLGPVEGQLGHPRLEAEEDGAHGTVPATPLILRPSPRRRTPRSGRPAAT